MLSDDMESLLAAAKKWILSIHTVQQSTVTVSDQLVCHSVESETPEPPLMKKFKYLAQRMSALQAQSGTDTLTNMKMEIGRYIAECRMLQSEEQVLDFWMAREQVYTLLTPVAEDIVSAPASEAYCTQPDVSEPGKADFSETE